MKETSSRSHLRKLVMAGLFIALDIVFTRFFSVMVLGVERVSLQFLPYTICGYMLGPVWTMAAAMVGDILGMMINSAGLAYFPGFTVSAGLRGLIYGLFLYQKPPSIKRAIGSEAVAGIGVSLLLNSVWLSIYYGKAFWGLLVTKAPIRLLMIPVAGYITYLVISGLRKALHPVSETHKDMNKNDEKKGSD